MTKIVDWVVLHVHGKGLSTALTALFANHASHLYGCVEKTDDREQSGTFMVFGDIGEVQSSHRVFPRAH